METLDFPFEVKSLNAEGRIEALISAFGQVDSYGDTVAPGAYAKSLAALASSGRKLPLLYQHDPHRPIGVWNELKETPAGLAGTAKLTMATRDGQEAHALAKDGALTGVSIGYRVPSGGSRMDGHRRVLTEIDLREASLVTFPADNFARLQAVKSVRCIGELRDLLQSHGFSGREAKAMAGAAWKARSATDDADDAEAALLSLLKAELGASASRIAQL